MNSKINRIQNVLLIILFVSIAVFFTLFNKVYIIDELWNFQIICKMCNGLQIYKDTNIITTPIFYYIGFFISSIFGAKLLVFRLYNVIIFLLLFIIINNILKKLKVSKRFRLLAISIMLEFFILIMSNGANYNVLTMLFIFIGIYLYVSKKSSNLLQGILIFLVFFTKQNLGVYYACGVILYELYIRESSKKFIINQIKKFLFFLIPTIIFLISMYFSGYLFEFINYSFGGLLEFGSNNIKFATTAYYVFLPIIVIGLYIFVCIEKNKLLKQVITKDVFDNLTLLFIFSMLMTLVVIPIVNTAHLILVIPLYFIYIFYFFDIILFEQIFDTDKYDIQIKWISVIIILILVIRVIIEFFTGEETMQITKKDSHFFRMYVSTDLIQKSNEMENYIKRRNEEGIDVIICSYDSAYITINLNQNHGVYDLLLSGNLGYNGIENVKADILSRENTEFLIKSNEKEIFWQEPLEIRECIIENLTYVGEICDYTIYKTEK